MDDLPEFVSGVNSKRYTDEEMNGWWDVTRVGEWYGSDGMGKAAKVEITKEKLEQMAEDYNPELHYAPVTTDHLDDGVALGYVEAVRVFGDKLQAKVSWADWGAFAVQDRAYVNRSIEMYDPMEYTGRAYLAGFTFLGAGKPAAKGLSPNPALLKDGQEITKITDNRMQLSEHAEIEMDEKTLKEKIIGWFKAGEISTTTEQENNEVELKEMEAKNTELSEKNTALTTENDDLKKQVEAKDAEITELKEAQEKAERDGKLSEITGKIKELGESGQMVPVEVEAEQKMAEAIPTDKLSEWWDERRKVYEARGLNILAEKTPDPTDKPAAHSRTAHYRKIANMSDNDEDRKLSLAACDLMDANEKLSFSEAVAQARAAQK